MPDTKTWRVRNVPIELIRRFKIVCVANDLTLGQGLIEAMSAWVDDKREER